jgi:copper(I)-binding protein
MGRMSDRGRSVLARAREGTAFVLLAILPAACAEREGGEVASLTITGAIVAEPVSGAERTAMYFSVTNRGESADELLSVSTPVAGRAEIHRTYADGGMMRMEEVSSLPVAAGETVSLAPGGLHVMLLDLNQPLWSGDRIDATLRFRAMGGVAIRAEVVAYEDIEEQLDQVRGSRQEVR